MIVLNYDYIGKEMLSEVPNPGYSMKKKLSHKKEKYETNNNVQ
tara:strand:+ start:683 stop:811 length:129 start_codon:yes stop_codon:yes gene_type:complete